MGTGFGKLPLTRLGKLATGLTAAVLFAALLRFTDQPERLVELPRNAASAFVSVHDGRVFYQPYRRDPAFSLIGLPVRGGRAQRLFDDPVVLTRPEDIQVTAAGIFYTFGEPGEQAQSGGPGSSPSGSSSIYTPPAGAPPARMRGLTRWPRLSRKRARWVPAGEHRATEMIPGEFASALQIRGDFCFWVRSQRTGSPLVTRQAKALEGDLMVASIRGGPYRKLGRVADDAVLRPCGPGVCWRQATANSRALLTCGPPDFNIEAFPNFPETSTPTWLGDRLYWLQGDPRVSGTMPTRIHALATARRDGADSRLLWDVDTVGDDRAVVSDLLDDGRDLYFSADRFAGAKPMRRILRYRTSRSANPETLLHTASVATGLRPIAVDEEYLYLLSWEERENWLDWSRDGLMRTRVGVLRRVALAH